MGWNFWIDRGGTFTDLVGISPIGEQVVRKVLSEQHNQVDDPAVNAIREVLGTLIPMPVLEHLIETNGLHRLAFMGEGGEPVG